jgi:hypothetical protein
MAQENSITPTPAPHGSNAYSEILEKSVDILSERDGEGFFNKRIENPSGLNTEKYSLSDVANFMQTMKKMSEAENAKTYSDEIHKPVRFMAVR